MSAASLVASALTPGSDAASPTLTAESGSVPTSRIGMRLPLPCLHVRGAADNLDRDGHAARGGRRRRRDRDDWRARSTAERAHRAGPIVPDRGDRAPALASEVHVRAIDDDLPGRFDDERDVRFEDLDVKLTVLHPQFRDELAGFRSAIEPLLASLRSRRALRVVVGDGVFAARAPELLDGGEVAIDRRRVLAGRLEVLHFLDVAASRVDLRVGVLRVALDAALEPYDLALLPHLFDRPDERLVGARALRVGVRGVRVRRPLQPGVRRVNDDRDHGIVLDMVDDRVRESFEVGL